MQKESNKWKKNKQLYVGALVIAMIIITCLLVSKLINPSSIYKIESRIDQVKTYKNVDEKIKTVGWLRVQGTNIDYPIIYNGPGVDISKVTDSFVWTQDNIQKLTNKTFIVGHNIRNVSTQPLITAKEHTRFEQLLSYIYYDFAKENKYIQYTIDGKDYLYKIFSISMVKDITVDYVSEDKTEKELKSYISQSLNDSYFDFDIDVNEKDKIITLSTCTRLFGNTREYTFQIDARMVREKESIGNYPVRKKSNYNKIEKILKGGEEDETNA